MYMGVCEREITRARAQVCGKEGVFCVNVSELEREYGGEGEGVGACVSEYVRVHLLIWPCLSPHTSQSSCRCELPMDESTPKKYTHTETHLLLQLFIRITERLQRKQST